MSKHSLLIFAVFLGITSCGGGGDNATPIIPATGLSLATNQVTFTADVTDATAAQQNLSGTVTGVNSNIRIDVIITGTAIVNATFTLTSTTGGQLTVTPDLPTKLGVGTHTAKISIYVCTDLANSCVGNSTQIPGSPKVVNVTYNVTTKLSTNIVNSSCAFTMGDTTQNPADGSAVFTKSHTIGAPKYKIVTTRQLADNSAVTMDYMVHEPMGMGAPKGVMVLIAGGGLNAGITGPGDNTTPTNSRGNFLVRSAHRYQAAGFRVITIDRPLDASNGVYGVNNIDIDKYRNSMQHAVDIATILKRENAEGYNVIISGTSRGAISAAAMNTLAAGIAMSSPVTSSPSGVPFAGYPVGSANLPLSRIKRVSHIMLHSNDTCAVTLPSASRNLFTNLKTAGILVAGSELTGGFQDTVRNDVCGAFDFHGYSGIETCAVNKETAWANSLMALLALNKTPVANNLTVANGAAIILTATDVDGDTLSYALPFATTSLGGTVATDSTGNVTYTAPPGFTGTEDTFAFTVTDGKGGVSTAVVKITFP